jgi:hypothetical protein
VLETGEVHTAFWWGDLNRKPLGRPTPRWEDNNKMDLQEIGRDWTDVTQNRDSCGSF